jgi:hypothetical protein
LDHVYFVTQIIFNIFVQIYFLWKEGILQKKSSAINLIAGIVRFFKFGVGLNLMFVRFIK